MKIAVRNFWIPGGNGHRTDFGSSMATAAAASSLAGWGRQDGETEHDPHVRRDRCRWR